jgi:hypothetical protein
MRYSKTPGISLCSVVNQTQYPFNIEARLLIVEHKTACRDNSAILLFPKSHVETLETYALQKPVSGLFSSAQKSSHLL